MLYGVPLLLWNNQKVQFFQLLLCRKGRMRALLSQLEQNKIRSQSIERKRNQPNFQLRNCSVRLSALEKQFLTATCLLNDLSWSWIDSLLVYKRKQSWHRHCDARCSLPLKYATNCSRFKFSYYCWAFLLWWKRRSIMMDLLCLLEM